MALQQEHSPTRPLDSPKTKVDSYKDPSQVALSEDPNSIMFTKDPSQLALSSTYRQVALSEDPYSIRFTKDSSKLVLFFLQYGDYTYPCLAQEVQASQGGQGHQPQYAWEEPP